MVEHTTDNRVTKVQFLWNHPTFQGSSNLGYAGVSKDLENSKFRVDENTELKRIEINLENLYVGQGKGETIGDETHDKGSFETKKDEDKGSSEIKKDKGAGLGFATAVEPTSLVFIGVLLSIAGLSAIGILAKTKKEV